MDPSVCSLCHPWFSTTNLSYRFPIVQLPPWCFEKKRNAHRLIAEPCHFWFPGVLGFGIILGFRIIFFGFRIILGCRIIGCGFRIIRFWLQNHPWFQNHSSSYLPTYLPDYLPPSIHPSIHVHTGVALLNGKHINDLLELSWHLSLGRAWWGANMNVLSKAKQEVWAAKVVDSSQPKEASWNKQRC